MTYLANESRRYRGKPVELYQFFYDSGTNEQFEAPAPFGTVVDTENWTYASTAAAMAVWVPFNPSSLIGGSPDGGIAGTFAMVDLRYIGALGSGGGRAYHMRTYSGLDPTCLYRASFRMTKDYATGWQATGGLIDGADGLKTYALDNVDGYITMYAFPKSDGTLGVGFGLLEAEWGAFVADPLTLTIYPVELAVDCAATEVPLVPGQRVEFNFTSSDVDWTFNGGIYRHRTMRRSALAAKDLNADSKEVQINLHSQHPVAQLFVNGEPPAPLNLKIYRFHRDDPTNYITAFWGQCATRKRKASVTTLTFAPVSSLLQRPTPRVLIQKPCNWMLGDEQCQVDLSAFTHTGFIVSAIDNAVITIPGIGAIAVGDDGYFNQGILVGPDGRKFPIQSWDRGDETVTIYKAILTGQLTVGDNVVLIAGDDNTMATCRDRFNNARHYGGFMGIRERSMFEGSGLE